MRESVPISENLVYYMRESGSLREAPGASRVKNIVNLNCTYICTELYKQRYGSFHKSFRFMKEKQENILILFRGRLMTIAEKIEILENE